MTEPDTPSATPLDPRLHAFRPDLADVRLRGRVEAERFVEGTRRVVANPYGAPLYADPTRDGGMVAEAWPGEPLRVFEQRDGWAWVARERDGYVGYTPAGLDEPPETPATHRVVAPRTFGYAEPDMKREHLFTLGLGAPVTALDERETRGTRYVHGRCGAAEGWFVAQHLRPAGEGGEEDWVDWAALLWGTPYLWGGETAFGLDCSGLVVLALAMAGRHVQRDSDMQAETTGEPVAMDELRRGTLVFWRGHMGIMEDETTLLHANGHTMNVAREPLSAAVERIGYLYGGPTGARHVAL